MLTHVSKRVILAVALSAVAIAGCGSTTPKAQIRALAGAGGSGFAWLRPAPPPSDWPAARIAAGATLRYPPDWRRIAGDPGTATAALQSAEHAFLGYLNVTPRQGNESLRSWASFRTRHNTQEGERAVMEIAAAGDLRFRNGRGSCVRDAYTTLTGNRFIELACLGQGPRTAAVIVGAAPAHVWGRISPTLEQAISALAG